MPYRLADHQRRGHGSGLFTEEQERLCIEWHAHFRTAKQIHEGIQQLTGTKCHIATVYSILKRKKWQPVIQRMRQEWAMGTSENPLAHKRYRLDRYARLLDALDTNPKVPPKERESRELKLLEQARLEMEAGKVSFTENYVMQINNYSDQELLQRRSELLKRIQTFRLPVRSLPNGGVEHRGESVEASGSVDPGDSGGIVHEPGPPGDVAVG